MNPEAEKRILVNDDKIFDLPEFEFLRHRIEDRWILDVRKLHYQRPGKNSRSYCHMQPLDFPKMSLRVTGADHCPRATYLGWQPHGPSYEVALQHLGIRCQLMMEYAVVTSPKRDLKEKYNDLAQYLVACWGKRWYDQENHKWKSDDLEDEEEKRDRGDEDEHDSHGAGQDEQPSTPQTPSTSSASNYPSSSPQAAESKKPPPNPYYKHAPKELTKAELERIQSPQMLEVLGHKTLTRALKSRGMKHTGDISIKAGRLWSIRGKEQHEWPPEVYKKTADACQSLPLIQLKQFHSAQEVESLGEDKLRELLKKRLLIYDGTLTEIAARVWSIRGRKPHEWDKKLFRKNLEGKRKGVTWKELLNASSKDDMAQILKPMQLKRFKSAQELESLGETKLRDMLKSRLLIYDGTLAEVTARIWSIRGKRPQEWDKKLFRKLEDDKKDVGKN